MKCRRCNKGAVYNLRQHRLAFCETHYLEWLPEQVERFIKHYQMFTRHDKILVAVSGGKDSLSAWDLLLRLGYHADAMTIQLGIDGGINYSTESQRCIQDFIAKFWPDAMLHTIDLKTTYGQSIPELALKNDRGHERPCSVCGLVKRHEMNRLAYELGYTVLVTGHNLDDEAAVLYGNLMNWQIDSLVRQAPVLEADQRGLARKVKPLCRFYERDMAAYALMRGIKYIYEECPYADGARTLQHKALLNQLENEQPGTKNRFYLGFLSAREHGLFTPPPQAEGTLHACPRCGQPTSTAQGLCAFCRVWTSNEQRGSEFLQPPEPLG